MSRAAVAIVLSAAERRELEGLARRRKTAQGLARRARIVLAGGGRSGEQGDRRAGGGGRETRSASGAGASPSAGWTGFTMSPGPGRRARSATSRSRRSSPAPWKRRRPTARTGACARWPARWATRRPPSTGSGEPSACSSTARRPSKLSTDPLFVEKVRDIVGLYLDPPERALVLCVDEKSQIQALDRSQPMLPMRPGQVERRSHD